MLVAQLRAGWKINDNSLNDLITYLLSTNFIGTCYTLYTQDTMRKGNHFKPLKQLWPTKYIEKFIVANHQRFGCQGSNQTYGW